MRQSLVLSCARRNAHGAPRLEHPIQRLFDADDTEPMHGCHRQDDVHRETLGENCSLCHNDKTWRQGIRFDHDLGNFPLMGQHAALGCEACHTSFVFSEAD